MPNTTAVQAPLTARTGRNPASALRFILAFGVVSLFADMTYEGMRLLKRMFWNEYMKAYEACLGASSTVNAPWYVVPADDKDNARLIVSQIVVDAFKELRMAYPETTSQRRAELQSIRKTLTKS
jgi:hypothetical protein